MKSVKILTDYTQDNAVHDYLWNHEYLCRWNFGISKCMGELYYKIEYIEEMNEIIDDHIFEEICEIIDDHIFEMEF